MMPHPPQLSPRTLGRTKKPVAPVLWHIEADTAPPADVLRLLPDIGATWFAIDPATGDDLLTALAGSVPGLSAVVGMTADQLTPRAADWLSRRLARLGLERADGVLVRETSPTEIKAGGPFHRLMQLRDRGLAATFWLDADDAATAEWMIDNTPAHAVCLAFSPAEQTAGYRVLPSAAEMGVALVARPGEASVDALSFIIAHPPIASILIPLPPTAEELARIATALAHPLPEPQRQQIQDTWRATHPEPPKPARNLPPDMA